MTDSSTSYVFSNGQKILAAEHNQNFSDLAAYLNSRNAGTSKWDLVRIKHETNVPIIADNSTGTQDIAQFKDNGVTVYNVADSGIWDSPAQSFVSVRNTTNEWTGDSEQFVLFTAPDIDTQSEFSQAVPYTTFTSKSSGKYLIRSNLYTQVASGHLSYPSSTILTLKKNGSAVSSATSYEWAVNTFVSQNYTQLSDFVNLSVGDYLGLYVTVAPGLGVVLRDILAGSSYPTKTVITKVA